MTDWLDSQAGLEQCQNNPQLYQQVLASFLAQHQDAIEVIKAACEKEQYSTVQDYAHALKSTAPAIGAVPLTATVCTLAPPAPAPDKSACLRLIDELEATLTAIEAYLPAPLPCPKDSAELLRRLEQHNLAAIDMYAQWYQSHYQEIDAKSHENIQSALSELDFTTAYRLFRAKIVE